MTLPTLISGAHASHLLSFAEKSSRSSDLLELPCKPELHLGGAVRQAFHLRNDVQGSRSRSLLNQVLPANATRSRHHLALPGLVGISLKHAHDAAVVSASLLLFQLLHLLALLRFREAILTLFQESFVATYQLCSQECVAVLFERQQPRLP